VPPHEAITGLYLDFSTINPPLDRLAGDIFDALAVTKNRENSTQRSTLKVTISDGAFVTNCFPEGYLDDVNRKKSYKE
jgi:hypothetical protein